MMRLRVERGTKPEPEVEPHGLNLALREIRDNLTLTKTDVYGWWHLGGVRWSFLTDAERENTLRDTTTALAGLAGRRVHLRVTQRPYGAHEWAQRRIGNARAYNSPDREALAGNLVADQRRMRGQRLADTEVYLGVWVCDRQAVERAALRSRELRRLLQEVAQISDVLDLPGLNGVPVDDARLSWLVRRSIGLHLPEQPDPPNLPADTTDLYGYEDVAVAYPQPLARTTRLADRRSGAERYVAVLSLGRAEDRDVPPGEPWAALAQRLPFPVEWSIRADIKPGKDARTAIRRKLDLFADQREQYAAHGLDAPPQLDTVTAQARRRLHEMTEGDTLASTTAHWWARLAVAGRTEDEALERVRQVTNLYGGVRVEVEHPKAQWHLLREFTPGEPLATVAHRRTGPVATLAAALPTVTATLGDREGHYLGWTAGTSRRVAMWDPHRALYAAETSGLTPVVGGLGSGKSALIGHIAYDAAMDGVSTTLLDPSGLLTRMCQLPELAESSSVVDVLNSPAGTLSPYVVVPDPPRSAFLDHPEVRAIPDTDPAHDRLVDDLHAESMALAEMDRKGLAIDVLHMLLEPQQLDDATPRIIQGAVAAAGGLYTGSLSTVLDRMESMEDRGFLLAQGYRDMAGLRGPAKFFPSGYATQAHRADPTLLVVSLAGASLPAEHSDPRSWSREQRHHVPLLHLAAWLVTRRVYARPMLEPKLVGADELGLLGGWGSGKTLLNRWARDSRKWRLRVLAASQDPAEVLGLDVAALVDDALVGRTTDLDVAARSLRLLGVQTGAGYERVLAGLSARRPDGTAPPYREFVARLNGGVERLVVDFGARPGLLAALTPGAPMPGDTEWQEAVA